MKKMYEEVKVILKKSQEEMKKYADRSKEMKKLMKRFMKPYKIEKIISDNMMKLELLKEVGENLNKIERERRASSFRGRTLMRVLSWYAWTFIFYVDFIFILSIFILIFCFFFYFISWTMKRHVTMVTWQDLISIEHCGKN